MRQHIAKTDIQRIKIVKRKSNPSAAQNDKNTKLLLLEGIKDWEGDQPWDYKERIEIVRDHFENTILNEYELKRFGRQGLMENWLRGLPSIVDVPFTNYDIYRLLVGWDLLSEDSTDRQVEKAQEQYWKSLAAKMMQLLNGRAIPKQVKQGNYKVRKNPVKKKAIKKNPVKKKVNKYTYYRVIQENNGYGWYDVDYHEANSQGVAKDMKALKENIKAYRVNSPHAIRVVTQKELATKKNPAKKKSTVRRKPVQAVQSKREKPANRGAVIVALVSLKNNTYSKLSFYTGSPEIQKFKGWNDSITKAAIYPTATDAQKVAKQLVKKIKNTRFIAVSRNATPAHMEKIFREGGFEKRGKK